MLRAAPFTRPAVSKLRWQPDTAAGRRQTTGPAGPVIRAVQRVAGFAPPFTPTRRLILRGPCTRPDLPGTLRGREISLVSRRMRYLLSGHLTARGQV
jgi:hypothetical protein